jgi:hypothetical protein
MNSVFNYCADGGHLVDLAHTLPDDPSDYHDGRRPIIGCNKLYCIQCRVPVRTVSGRAIPASLQNDLTARYAVEDLTGLPAVGHASPFREYFCRCESRTATSYHPVDDPDEGLTSLNVPWRCAGHPPVVLPHDFDGAPVRDEPALVAMVYAALAGVLPPRAHQRDGPATWWLIRLYSRVARTPYAELVAATVAAALDHADPPVRGRALRFFFTVALPIGQHRALELYEQRPDLYTDVPDEVTDVTPDKTLEHSLWRAAGPLTAAPGRARDLARAHAVTPGRGSQALYSALAREDAAWFAEHIEAIFRATPALHEVLALMVRARFPEDMPREPALGKLRALVAATGPAPK